MKKPKKGLSSFQTFWIFGCGVAFFGVILSNTPLIWTGLLLLVIICGHTWRKVVNEFI
jgi:hypothetical protein